MRRTCSAFISAVASVTLLVLTGCTSDANEIESSGPPCNGDCGKVVAATGGASGQGGSLGLGGVFVTGGAPGSGGTKDASADGAASTDGSAGGAAGVDASAGGSSGTGGIVSTGGAAGVDASAGGSSGTGGKLDAGLNEASPDVETGPPVTTDSLLSARSATCQACAKTNCFDQQNAFACEFLTLTDNAPAGPAAGTSRRTLCYQTLSCIFSTGCANAVQGVSSCYCGTASNCLASGQDGACKSIEESGLESIAPSTIASNFTDTTYGGGVANGIVSCLSGSCSSDCL